MHRGVFTAMTRRAALLTVGAVGLATLASPRTTDARKKHTKRRNNGDANKLCKKQVGQCLAFFTPLCEDDAECLEGFERCCPSLGTCDFDGFFLCVEALDAGVRP